MMRLRTWVEINTRAALHNIAFFRKRLKAKTQLWAVVKSNAYGHGLVQFAQLVEKKVDGFCVDSILEGLRLREEGIKKSILVLGSTLPALFKDAGRFDITISVSTFDELRALKTLKKPPAFHIKIDTGMHRRGFLPEEILKVIAFLKINISQSEIRNRFQGLMTHFASAKDIYYPTATELQFNIFQKVRSQYARAGFKHSIAHCAATGGTLLNKKYHLDAVRIGMGLYGYMPSSELSVALPGKLKPVLSWRSLVTEIKEVPKGSHIGYDFTETVTRKTKIGIVPIGYWHGFPRALSSRGEVIVSGRRARVLGRVSMDLIAVDLTGIAVKPYARVTLIGSDRGEVITAEEFAERMGTTQYEALTRLNPLMERRVDPSLKYISVRDRG